MFDVLAALGKRRMTMIGSRRMMAPRIAEQLPVDALQRSTRRLWSWRSEFGHATHWSQRLGRAVCAGGAAALWPALTAGGAGLALEPMEPDPP